MRLTTKGRYGLRAVLALALHQSRGPVALSSIAESQDISEGYLEQLMVPLKRAAIVKSVRGAQGGYVLARDPKMITVGEVIRALEGPIAPVACVSEEFPEECRRASGCATRLVWERVRNSIAETLDSFTLQDLVDETRKLSSGGEQHMYYI